jgi:hypothetical protein
MAMQRFHAALYAFIFLVIASASLQAKEKVRVEVVEAYTYSYIDSLVRTVPGAPEQAITNCVGTSGIYLPNYGSTCVTTKNPATPEHSVIWPTTMGAFDAVAAILPNGEHLLLICDRDHKKHCDKFVDEKNSGIEKSCTDQSAGIPNATLRYLCVYTMHGSASIGQFDAVIDGDRFTIAGPNGKREYRKSGTWGGPSASYPGKDGGKLEIPVSSSESSTAGITAGSDAHIDPQLMAKANVGNAAAQYNLGYDYYLGQGIQQDYAQAAVWWRKAAEQGNVESQGNLGVLYFNGQGVPQSYVEAASWYRKAAEQGNAEAQHNLGLLYSNGEGVQKDDAQAALWWRRSADQNNALAQCSLGVLFGAGQGVPQNYAEAYFWLDLAVAGIKGPEKDKCEKSRDDFGSKLLPAELSKMQERAAKWFAEHPTQP